MAVIPGSTSFGLFTNHNINVDGASTLYNSFLVASEFGVPPGVAQIGPFAFDYEGDDTVSLVNDITDHWVEDNVAVQDHIGIKPVMITLMGRTSELTLKASVIRTISGSLSAVENGLSQVAAFGGVGKYTTGVADKMIASITQVQNIAVQIEQAAARIAQIANFFTTKGAQNNQQKAFTMLSALRNARTIFTVFTPFQVFYNMAIISVTAKQPAGTKTISDFTVTMKQLQFTDNISQSSLLTQYGGRAAAGYTPKQSGGFAAGVSARATTVTNFFTKPF